MKLTLATVKLTIESSEVTNESSEVINESSGITNESSEVTNESSKLTNESSGITIESSKVTNESSKVTIESSEVINESSKVTIGVAGLTNRVTEIEFIPQRRMKNHCEETNQEFNPSFRIFVNGYDRHSLVLQGLRTAIGRLCLLSEQAAEPLPGIPNQEAGISHLALTQNFCHNRNIFNPVCLSP
ncbi:MAG: hypothetical protein SFY66_00980 [Oculatellaceae cyanobacterium bins.114]|nr:hypothetical protein [Oculatellaceae cyanobacterium bins.114]